MMGYTHLAGASLAYLGSSILLESKLHISDWLACLAASLLPDVDLPQSMAGRCLPGIAGFLESRYPHRTLTHSIIGCMIFALLVSPLAFMDYQGYQALIMGYLSHLLLDLFNPRGIDIFWPSTTPWVMLADFREKLPQTGSREEHCLLTFILLLHPLAYPVAESGLRNSLQYWLRDFSVSTEAYANSPRDHWQYLDVNATDNWSHEPRQCRCLILARWHDGLLLEYQHQTVTVGRGASEYQWFPHQAYLIEGDRLIVKSEHINMQGRSLAEMNTLGLTSSARIFLTGQLNLNSRSNTASLAYGVHQSVWQRENQLHMTMANPESLKPWFSAHIMGGSLRIDAWLHPDEAQPDIAYPVVREKRDILRERIEASLRHAE